MLRSAILSVANRPAIRRIATGGIGRRVALRFVAGEELAQAIAVGKDLNAAGAAVSLDHLGENVTDGAHARAAATAYHDAIERIAQVGLSGNVSVKLTQIGLDLDPDLAFKNAEAIVQRAAEAQTTVTFDMEDHRYTDRTLEVAARLAGTFPDRVGVALQAYLHRTREDLDRMIAAGAGVRLCKGAYREPRTIAFRRRRDVDAAFARLTTRLLASRVFAMIATHDERLVRHALRRIRGRAPDTYEFQMLYGVRREMQARLIEAGRPVRVYLPFGSQWYPYLTRRIAERPANVRFFIEALLRG